jgi:hypothetical protein
MLTKRALGIILIVVGLLSAISIAVPYLNIFIAILAITAGIMELING